MTEDDKQYCRFVKIMILILFISGLLIGLVIGLGKEEEVCQSNYSDNFISAFNCPVFIENQTLASMSDDIDIVLLAEKIIRCESSWRSNVKNPESSAYGLGQFTNGTWKYIQEKWGIELDRDDLEDQMYIVVRLLEEEGTKHWITSKSCWNK